MKKESRNIITRVLKENLYSKDEKPVESKINSAKVSNKYERRTKISSMNNIDFNKEKSELIVGKLHIPRDKITNKIYNRDNNFLIKGKLNNSHLNSNHSLNKSSKICISCSPKNEKNSHINSMSKSKIKTLCDEDNNLKLSNNKPADKSIHSTLTNINTIITVPSKSQREEYQNDKTSQNLSLITNTRNENEVYKKIYNIFMNKILEFQERIRMYENNSILDCLIKSFDSLSQNYKKFRKISEMLNIFCDTDKSNNILDNYKEEYNKVLEENTKLKIANEKIKAFEILLESKDNAINDLKKKNSYLLKKMDNYKEIVKENSLIKTTLKEKTVDLDKIKEKEVKLMKIIFYLNKKAGISLEEAINNLENLDNSGSKYQISNENQSSSSVMNTSEMTVYFPDKTPQNPTNNNSKKFVPKLNFNNLPSYESPPSSKDNEMIKINVNIDDKNVSNNKNIYEKIGKHKGKKSLKDFVPKISSDLNKEVFEE